jgi:hypothetical protein
MSWLFDHPLTVVIFLPLVGAAVIAFLNRQRVAARGAWRERIGALRDRLRRRAERARP